MGDWVWKRQRWGDVSEQDNVEEQLSDSDSEQSENDVETVNAVTSISSLLGKNGHRWSTHPPAKTRSYISISRTGLEFVVQQTNDINLLHTNEDIHRKCNTIGQQSYIKPVNYTEIKAFIGVFLLASALRVSNCNLEELWSVKFGNGIFRSIMSLQRFIALYLRFDSKENRAEILLVDKFAHIRELFVFFNNCKSYYTPYLRILYYRWATRRLQRKISVPNLYG